MSKEQVYALVGLWCMVKCAELTPNHDRVRFIVSWGLLGLGLLYLFLSGGQWR